MKENQSQIFYIAGTDKDMLYKSPMMQKLVKRGYEVLIMDDPIDEFAIERLED